VPVYFIQRSVNHHPRPRVPACAQYSSGTTRDSPLFTYVLAGGASGSNSSLNRLRIGLPPLRLSSAFATNRPRGSFGSGTALAGSRPGGGLLGGGIRVRDEIRGGAECAERTWTTGTRAVWSAKGSAGSIRTGAARGGGGGGRRVAERVGAGEGEGMRTAPLRARVTGTADGDWEDGLPRAAFVRAARADRCEPRPWRELKERFGRCVKAGWPEKEDAERLDPLNALCTECMRYEETAMLGRWLLFRG